MKKITKKSVALKASNVTSEQSSKSHKKSATALPIILTEIGSDKYQNAFDSTKDERDALQVSELIPRTIDTAGAVSIALSALPAMKAFRASIKNVIPSFDVDKFDKLEEYANALFHADGLVASTPDTGGANDLYEGCISFRDMFTNDLKALITRKLLDEKVLADISNASGFRNVAVAVMSLSTIARTHWAAICSKTALTTAEIERARDLAGQLLTLSTSREKTEATNEAIQTRHRAATLLVMAYADVRDALAYVRRKEGDAATIAPSLYGHRGRPAKKGDMTTPTAPPVTAVPPIVATPTPSAVAEPAAPVVASPGDDMLTMGATPTDQALSTSLNGSAQQEMHRAPTS